MDGDLTTRIGSAGCCITWWLKLDTMTRFNAPRHLAEEHRLTSRGNAYHEGEQSKEPEDIYD